MAHVEVDWAGDRPFPFALLALVLVLIFIPFVICGLIKAQKEASYSVLADCVAQTESELRDLSHPQPILYSRSSCSNGTAVGSGSIAVNHCILLTGYRSFAPRSDQETRDEWKALYRRFDRAPCRWRHERKLNLFDELAVQGPCPP
jgi:hypothetical protein